MRPLNFVYSFAYTEPPESSALSNSACANSPLRLSVVNSCSVLSNSLSWTDRPHVI